MGDTQFSCFRMYIYITESRNNKNYYPPEHAYAGEIIYKAKFSNSVSKAK